MTQTKTPDAPPDADAKSPGSDTTDETATTPAAIWAWDELPEVEDAPTGPTSTRVDIDAEVPATMRAKIDALFSFNADLAETDLAKLEEIMYPVAARTEGEGEDAKVTPLTDEQTAAIVARAADTADKLSKSTLRWEWKVQRLMADAANAALPDDKVEPVQKAAAEICRLMKRYGKYRSAGQITVRAITLDAKALKALKIDAHPDTIVKFCAKPLENRKASGSTSGNSASVNTTPDAS